MNPPPPIIEPPVAPLVAATPTSLAARLLNVFAMPGTVFEEVRLSPRNTANWLVPALLAGMVFAVSFLIVASRPDFAKKNRAIQERTLEQLVKEGKSSRADADQVIKLMDQLFDSGALKVFGIVGGLIAGLVRVFWWGFVLWFLSRTFLRTKVGFGKMMEASGLGGMIGLLAVVVTLLLEMNLHDQLASASMTSGLDFKNPVHIAILAMNFFQVWQAIVLASALARMADVPFVRGALVLFPFWLLSMSAAAIIGSGLLRMAG